MERAAQCMAVWCLAPKAGVEPQEWHQGSQGRGKRFAGDDSAGWNIFRTTRQDGQPCPDAVALKGDTICSPVRGWAQAVKALPRGAR